MKILIIGVGSAGVKTADKMNLPDSKKLGKYYKRIGIVWAKEDRAEKAIELLKLEGS